MQINGPAFVYGENQSVVCNTTIPESTISKKKHSSMYHVVREGAARTKWIT